MASYNTSEFKAGLKVMLDNDPGSILENVFVKPPFQQIDDGLARNREGTGLGLAITQRLLGLMGGSIAVASEFGRGSTFTLTLPTNEGSLP